MTTNFTSAIILNWMRFYCEHLRSFNLQQIVWEDTNWNAKGVDNKKYASLAKAVNEIEGMNAFWR